MCYNLKMKNKIITIVVLVAVLAVSIYGYEMVFKKPLVESPVEDTTETMMSSLDVKEQYNNGVYTYAGKIQTPTPCHTVDAKAMSVDENIYAINITITPPAEGIMCAQVISEKDYKVTFAAPENAIVKAYINGIEYKINPFEVPAGQNIDDFDISIKG